MRLLFLIFLLLFFESIPAQQSGENNLVSHSFFLPKEKTILYKLGETFIPIVVIQYGNAPAPVCINLHDNEKTSVEAARLVLEQSGGLIIKLENKNKRLINFHLRGRKFSFDPNGIFSREGIQKTLKQNGNSAESAILEIEKFAKRLLQLIPEESKCLIALHNNKEGGFSIKNFLPGGEKAADAKMAHRNELQKADDLFFTTDSSIHNKMVAKGYNSVLQDNLNAEKDGSLSVYYGEMNKQYVNVETMHGRLKQYKEMLKAVIFELNCK